MAKNMEIKSYYFIFISFILLSCSSTKDSSKLDEIVELYKNQNKEVEIIEIPREKILNLPYEILEIRTNGILKQGVFLSMTSRSTYKNFTSGMGQIVTFNGAILTKTNGLDVFLNSLEIRNKNPFNNITKIEDLPQKINKVYKFLLPTNKEQEIELSCLITPKNEENITILNQNYALNKVVETCKNSSLNHTNIYWLDGNGFIWKSRQWISQDNKYAEITVLKKI